MIFNPTIHKRRHICSPLLDNLVSYQKPLILVSYTMVQDPKWVADLFLVGACVTRVPINFHKPGSQGEIRFLISALG